MFAIIGHVVERACGRAMPREVCKACTEKGRTTKKARETGEFEHQQIDEHNRARGRACGKIDLMKCVSNPKPTCVEAGDKEACLRWISGGWEFLHYGVQHALGRPKVLGPGGLAACSREISRVHVEQRTPRTPLRCEAVLHRACIRL